MGDTIPTNGYTEGETATVLSVPDLIDQLTPAAKGKLDFSPRATDVKDAAKRGRGRVC